MCEQEVQEVQEVAHISLGSTSLNYCPFGAGMYAHVCACVRMCEQEVQEVAHISLGSTS